MGQFLRNNGQEAFDRRPCSQDKQHVTQGGKSTKITFSEKKFVLSRFGRLRPQNTVPDSTSYLLSF
jgi:hypothetical protein